MLISNLNPSGVLRLLPLLCSDMMLQDQMDSPVADDGSSSRGGSRPRRGARQLLKKGPWTSAEDAILVDYVKKHGEGNWNAVQTNSGLFRCGRSCRLRWLNHLRPNLKKGAFTPEEELLIIELHAKIGNRWARMAAHLPGRTDNEIKNYWNTRIKICERAGLPIYPASVCNQSSEEATLLTGKSSSAGVQLPVPTTSTSSDGEEQLVTPSPPTKKQRGLVDTPDADVEVIALSPRTLMATDRYMCEVCGKGFQQEQNLQLHRRVHNLPSKLKQKNPLQPAWRLVYVCPEPTCVHHDPSRPLGDLTAIKKHFCRKHGEKKWKCDKCNKRYAVQSDWKAHSKTCSTREYRCDCGTLFPRRDIFITHRASCDALAEESAKLPAPVDSVLLQDRVGGGVGLPERALPYKSPSLCLASDLKQFSSHDSKSKQFTPSPHMSTSLVVQNILQMGATSSNSSSLINKQEIIGRFKEEHEHEEMKMGVDTEHGGIVGRADEKRDIIKLIMSQMGDTSSNSSSLIDNQEIIGRVKEEHEYEEMKIGVDTEHGGIVGRADEKRDIIKLIMSHGPSNKRFAIICITGGHGLGKTTLASLVYWDDTMCRSFEARAWMCLSHVTDIEELLRSTVSSLTGVSCRLNDRDELEELVKEELMGKKFLLVLDDLHENNVEICKRLIQLLSLGDKGSAVIVTTSTNVVVGSLGTAHAYNLKPFMHDEFLNMATPHSVQYSPLKSIISRIPSQFFGFPTFAKAIRGIIYSAFTQEHLELDECLGVTLDGILTDILNKPDNLLDNLLCLSYSYLSPNQQRCYAYCSMFPKDYTYNKEKLLRLWMSQGFIIPDREKDRDGDHEDAFDELLHRSFFDHCPSSDYKEQKYVMHEFSSHAARTASGEKFFRAHDHELDCIPKDVHHLSVIPKQCDSEIYFSSFAEFRDLSTFLLVHNSQLDSSDSQFHVMDVKALEECFRSFRCLKTLDLSHTDIKELPESIGHMTSMCFLGLNNTNLRRLPNSICNLLQLQTLELQNSAFLVELPNNIKYLNSLHHLDASKEHGPIYVPPGIGQLKNLRTLTTFTVGGVSWSCKLSELAQLNSLRGSLHIQCLNDVENAGDAEGACLASKKLNKLSLEWFHSEDVESDDRIYVAEHVLDALKPHSLLGELNIKGYYGLVLPSWMADHTLSNLISITLDNCHNCKKLPPLGTLPSLRSLFIQNLRAVQLISYEFYANGTINHKSFPKLETLKLRDMYNLECWHDILVGDFPLLHSLSIERCPKLKSIPRFQFISDASIMSCSSLNLPGLESLQTLKVGNLKQGKCFALPCELSSLLMLEIICCGDLCSVEGLSRLQSLKHLKFRGCPRLKFDQDDPLPYTLETVDVHSNCYGLSNWVPHGFEELLNASEVYRKFIRRKCEDDKGVKEEVMQEP